MTQSMTGYSGQYGYAGAGAGSGAGAGAGAAQKDNEASYFIPPIHSFLLRYFPYNKKCCQ